MLINTPPDINKVKSILKMVETTLTMVDSIDEKKFPSNVTKEYYNIIRELLSIVLLLDGKRTVDEGAHKEIIEHVSQSYKLLTQNDIIFLDDLRRLRNRISYDGFFINASYLERNKAKFKEIINKLKKVIKERLSE